jgi:hypothetical protein
MRITDVAIERKQDVQEPSEQRNPELWQKGIRQRLLQ